MFHHFTNQYYLRMFLEPTAMLQRMTVLKDALQIIYNIIYIDLPFSGSHQESHLNLSWILYKF